MVAKTIRDWLAQYKTLSDSQLPSFANALKDNNELIESLYELFEDEQLNENSDPIFHQLFDFYRSTNKNLRLFTLDLVPVLIWSYLSTISRYGNKHCSGIESCLLGIYNLDATDSSGKAANKSFVCPTLAESSIYHEPPSLASLVLSESVMLRFHNAERQKIVVGPVSHVERINAQNRCEVLAAIVARYYTSIGHVSGRSLRAACRLSSRLMKSGFEQAESDSVSLNDSMGSNSPRRAVHLSTEPRVVVSAGLMLQLTSVIYFAMYNGHPKEAVQAVRDVQWRATYEVYADVLMVTSAILNSLRMTLEEQPQDGPMGLSSALSPHQLAATYSKSAITNASFRAKKLPDDIDVPEDAETNEAAMDTEEHADTDRSRMALPAKLLKLNPLKSALKKTDKSKSKSGKEGKSKDSADGGLRSPRNSISLTSGLVSASDMADAGPVDSLANRLAKRDTEEDDSEPEESIPLVTVTRPAEDNTDTHLLASNGTTLDDSDN